MSKRLKFISFVLFAAIAVSMIGLTACEGTAGKDGAAGAPGKSAYDIWLEQGNTGTEQDFLDSLKGDRGEAPEITVGSNGNWYVDGVDTGVKAQGNQGIQGPQGNPGDPGKDGPSFFSGNGCPDEIDVVPLTPNSKTGDLYLCSDCGALWQKGSDGFWDEIANLKGPKGDKGDPGESGQPDDSFKLNVSAGQTAEMPIDLAAGVYVVEVALDMKMYGSSGRFLASVESNETPSSFTFSQSRTDAANNGTFVYYTYVIVEESDTKITFAPEADFKLDDGTNSQMPKPTVIENAKVSIKDYVQPTIKADGVAVEIPVNGTKMNGDKLLKVAVDSSIVAGSYTFIMTETSVSSTAVVGIFDQTDSTITTKKIGYCGPGEEQVTLNANLTNDYLIFKTYSGHNYLCPATITITVVE